jgi:hypothetical protein
VGPRLVRCHVGGGECSSGGGRVHAGSLTHRGAWIGLAGGDLDVPQVHARVEHGGDEGEAARHCACLHTARSPKRTGRGKRGRREWPYECAVQRNAR